MMKNGQHVVPRDGGWGVLRSGAQRVAKVFATRDEAVAYGRERAQSLGSVLYIHGVDGLIHQRDSFEKTSAPAKG